MVGWINDLVGTLRPLLPRESRERRRRVVYTCLFGYSEFFNNFVYRTEDSTEFICFTDDPELSSEFWTILCLPNRLLDPVRMAKKIKLLPHLFLSHFEESLYLDNTVRLRMPPAEVFELLGATPSSIICARHPVRSCLYEEAEAVIAAGYDDPAVIERQMRYYRRIGYPERHGLVQSNILLRRHNDPHIIGIGMDWFEQVLRYSYRDQLSFNVVCWVNRFVPGLFQDYLSVQDLCDWPIIKEGIRVPRDFDDERYWTINPDTIGMSPRRHYLRYGAKEGRSYK